ncbi:MAG: hypothetical protein LBT26_11515 [Clostridiales Family XIII bacterium]|jgi:hypothetical protein|nr:hypothetical protein [Clostridiales Family XIII bacterium]
MHASKRKLAITGWLLENKPETFRSSLRYQKFLFFCESICAAEGEPYEFGGLKGYRKGPVFGAIWKDYTREKDALKKSALAAYMENGLPVPERYVALAEFVCNAFTEDELSDITHRMDIWKAGKERIESGEPHVQLSASDFSESDADLVREFAMAFPPSFIERKRVVRSGGTRYLFDAEDAARLTESHKEELCRLDSFGGFENPVYSYIDERGVLVFD